MTLLHSFCFKCLIWMPTLFERSFQRKTIAGVVFGPQKAEAFSSVWQEAHRGSRKSFLARAGVHGTGRTSESQDVLYLPKLKLKQTVSSLRSFIAFVYWIKVCNTLPLKIFKILRLQWSFKNVHAHLFLCKSSHKFRVALYSQYYGKIDSFHSHYIPLK